MRRGLSGCHRYPGTVGVSGGVVSPDTELVLCPGTQTSHCICEGVSMLWGRFSEQHLLGMIKVDELYGTLLTTSEMCL